MAELLMPRSRYKTPMILPSLFAADHGRLDEAVRGVLDAGIQHFHIDIMDGRFVPSIGLSIKLISDLKASCPQAQFHVHLMTSEPEALILPLADAGADSITFHIEASAHAEHLLRQIKAVGILAGIALNPGTSPDALKYLRHTLDIVLIMTINPGQHKQIFIPEMLGKISEVRQLLPQTLIVADGQISAETIPSTAAAGADFIVVGRAAFEDDPRHTLPYLRRLL